MQQWVRVRDAVADNSLIKKAVTMRQSRPAAPVPHEVEGGGRRSRSEGAVTAVIKHPRSEALELQYLQWLEDMRATVRHFQGFEDLNVVPRQDHYLALLDFSDVQSLNAWTDSKERQALLERLPAADGELPELEVRHCTSVVELASAALASGPAPKWKLLLVSFVCELPTNLAHAKLDTLAWLMAITGDNLILAILGMLVLTVPWLVYAPIALLTRLPGVRAWLHAPRPEHCQWEPWRTLEEGLRIFEPGRDDDLLRRVALMERRAHALRQELEHLGAEEIHSVGHLPSVEDFIKKGALTKGFAPTRQKSLRRGAKASGPNRGAKTPKRRQQTHVREPRTPAQRQLRGRRAPQQILDNWFMGRARRKRSTHRLQQPLLEPADRGGSIEEDLEAGLARTQDQDAVRSSIEAPDEAKDVPERALAYARPSTSASGSTLAPGDLQALDDISIEDEPECADEARASKPRPVTVAVLHTVRWQCRDRFLRLMGGFREALENVCGFMSFNIIAEPLANAMDDPKFTLLYKFESWSALEVWESSPERVKLLNKLNKLLNDKPRWHVEEESALVETEGEVHDALTALWATHGRAAPPIWKVVLLSIAAKEVVLIPLNHRLAPNLAAYSLPVALRTLIMMLVAALLVVFITVPFFKLAFSHWLNDAVRRPGANSKLLPRVLDGGLPSTQARLLLLLLYAIPLLVSTSVSASNVQLF